MSAAAIRDSLAALGVGRGSHVGLGVSLRSVGTIEGSPPPTVLDVLRELIGPAGTLLLPSFSPKYPLTSLRLGRVADVYDPTTSPITTGAAAKMVHAIPGAVRSRHPTNSYVAIGAGAEALLATHDHTEGSYEPYRRLASIGGVLLSIGLGDVFPAARHLPQVDAGLIELVRYRYGAYFRDEAGRVQLFVRKDIGGCIERLPSLVGELRTAGLLRESNVGAAEAIACDAGPALRAMTEALRTRPTDYLCGDSLCLWCREVERKLASQGRAPAAHVPAALTAYNWVRRNEPIIDGIMTKRLKRWLHRTG